MADDTEPSGAEKMVTVAALTTGGNTEQLVFHLGLATQVFRGN